MKTSPASNPSLPSGSLSRPAAERAQCEPHAVGVAPPEKPASGTRAAKPGLESDSGSAGRGDPAPHRRPRQCAFQPASPRGTPRTPTLFLTGAAASPHLPPPSPTSPPPPKKGDLSERACGGREINPRPDSVPGTCFHNLPLNENHSSPGRWGGPPGPGRHHRHLIECQGQCEGPGPRREQDVGRDNLSLPGLCRPSAPAGGSRLSPTPAVSPGGPPALLCAMAAGLALCPLRCQPGARGTGDPECGLKGAFQPASAPWELLVEGPSTPSVGLQTAANIHPERGPVSPSPPSPSAQVTPRGAAVAAQNVSCWRFNMKRAERALQACNAVALINSGPSVGGLPPPPLLQRTR